MNTYILSSYAALQTVDHEDITRIAQAVTHHGGTTVTLPQTVIAVMTSLQYAKLSYQDVAMVDNANMLCLHTYSPE